MPGYQLASVPLLTLTQRPSLSWPPLPHSLFGHIELASWEHLGERGSWMDGSRFLNLESPP